MATAIIGAQATGANSVQAPPANSKAVSRFQNTAASPVTFSAISFYFITTTPASHTKAVVYSDTSSLPNVLLGTSSEVVGTTAFAWSHYTLTAPVTIAAGAFVWIGLIGDANVPNGGCNVLTGGIKYNSNTYVSGPSNPFGASPSTANFVYSAYTLGDDGQLSFGRSSVEPATGTYFVNRPHADKFVLGGTAPVLVQSISTYVKTTSGSVKARAGIYADSAGYPGSKIAQTGETTGTTANTWLTLPFSPPPLLTPGTYWLTYVDDTDIVTPTAPLDGALVACNSAITNFESTAWPSSYPALTLPVVNDAPMGIDIYATYTLPTGGPIISIIP